MAKRTDIHREGAIVPSDYDYLTSYALPSTMGGWPVPAIGIEYVLKLHAEHPRAEHGGLGKCTLCGANYNYGDVWQHRETKELIHVGHDCAEKVGFVADRAEYEGMRLAVVEGIRKQKKLLKKCGGDEALFEALWKGKHPIIRDMVAKLWKYGSLSEKQRAFAMSLYREEEADGSGKPVEAWLPVEGNTFPVKDQIKALGGRWDSKARVWMVRESKHAEAMALLAPVPQSAVDEPPADAHEGEDAFPF